MLRVAVVAFVVVCSAGCDIIGPSCIARQERGAVTTISGDAAPGRVVAHLVRYATEGSQNDVHFSWSGSLLADGPRLTLYATRAACANFSLPPANNRNECAVIRTAGWINGHIATPLIITHGRGNPEILGTPPEYKLWVVGDPERSARYTIDITWFYGPDC